MASICLYSGSRYWDLLYRAWKSSIANRTGTLNRRVKFSQIQAARRGKYDTYSSWAAKISKSALRACGADGASLTPASTSAFKTLPDETEPLSSTMSSGTVMSFRIAELKDEICFRIVLAKAGCRKLCDRASY